MTIADYYVLTSLSTCENLILPHAAKDSMFVKVFGLFDVNLLNNRLFFEEIMHKKQTRTAVISPL